ncbi:hypothetical protein [Arthrobacter sp. MDT1-65]
MFMFLGGVVTAGGVVGAALFASRSSVKVKEIDVAATAASRLEAINVAAFARMQGEIDAVKASHKEQGKEIASLRTSVDKVNRVFQIAMNFIEQFLLWERDGSRPPRPNIPAELKEFLDPALIREHRRQQEEDVIR